MVDFVVEATIPPLQSWESRVELEGGIADIRIDEDLKNLSANFVSKACFKSKGKETFQKM